MKLDTSQEHVRALSQLSFDVSLGVLLYARRECEWWYSSVLNFILASAHPGMSKKTN